LNQFAHAPLLAVLVVTIEIACAGLGLHALPEWIAKLSSMGLTNVEMESSALFVVARLRGLRAAMICAVSGNLVTGDVTYGAPNERLKVGWRHSILVALEAVHRLEL